LTRVVRPIDRFIMEGKHHERGGDPGFHKEEVFPNPPYTGSNKLTPEFLRRPAPTPAPHPCVPEALPVPAPRWLARFNRRVTNPLLGRLATRLPGFGVVVHTGRKTHRQYRTPVNVFQRADGFVVALTYGPDAEWVRNVVATGGCLLETRRRTVRLSQPRLYHDERRRAVPAPVRLALALGNVADFLELTPHHGVGPADVRGAGEDTGAREGPRSLKNQTHGSGAEGAQPTAALATPS
jgi:deazaflavin-dependent oxidoreductase (nitroreductase family)